jgi:hypothetical protein
MNIKGFRMNMYHLRLRLGTIREKRITRRDGGEIPRTKTSRRVILRSLRSKIVPRRDSGDRT